jgi:hypothetical protein
MLIDLASSVVLAVAILLPLFVRPPRWAPTCR